MQARLFFTAFIALVAVLADLGQVFSASSAEQFRAWSTSQNVTFRDSHTGRLVRTSKSSLTRSHSARMISDGPGRPEYVASLVEDGPDSEEQNPADDSEGLLFNGLVGDFIDRIVGRGQRRRVVDEPRGILSRVVCPNQPLKKSGTSVKATVYFHPQASVPEVRINETDTGKWQHKDVDQLVANGLDASKLTLIYLGGWMQDQDVNWLMRARQVHDSLATSHSSPYNLMIFDWRSYSAAFEYGSSVALAPHIGRVLANLMQHLVERHRFKPNLLHVVSYSLSTHIAGYAGRLMQRRNVGRIAQITAIDPTGVCFHRETDRSWNKRFGLRPSDAAIVLARHYDLEGLGARRAIGGVDVMVNGGKNQPTMSLRGRTNLRDIMGRIGTFGHARAVHHEEEPFKADSDCHEIAYGCSSETRFLRGQCANCGSGNQSCLLISTVGNIVLHQRPNEMRFRPDTELHISTGVDSFCLYHYQVVAQLSANATRSDLEYFRKGRFTFTIGTERVTPRFRYDKDEDEGQVENDDQVLDRYTSKDEKNTPEPTGAMFTQLLRAENRILAFPAKIKLSSPRLALDSVAVNYMSHVREEKRREFSMKYCLDSEGNALIECCPDSA